MKAYQAFLRRRLLEDMYDRMSEDDKRLFVQMTLQDKSSEEIRQALKKQSAVLQAIKRDQQTFASDFISNLTANATWDGLMWLGGKLLRSIKL